jgi:predicted membrane protein (TIGR00267 family)
LGTSLSKLRSDLRWVRGNEIARRYLVLNAFDGVLTTLGVVAGAYLAGATQARIILIAGLGASLAMGISGAWGAYMTERAERRRAISELERQLFTSLRGSTIEEASRTAVFLIALIDGLSPLVTSVICLSPLLFSLLGFMPLGVSIAVSTIAALAILFILGVFLAKISNTNLAVQGVLMVLAGALIFALAYLLGVG